MRTEAVEAAPGPIVEHKPTLAGEAEEAGVSSTSAVSTEEKV
jgi:hypothetical protein